VASACVAVPTYYSVQIFQIEPNFGLWIKSELAFTEGSVERVVKQRFSLWESAFGLQSRWQDEVLSGWVCRLYKSCAIVCSQC